MSKTLLQDNRTVKLKASIGKKIRKQILVSEDSDYYPCHVLGTLKSLMHFNSEKWKILSCFSWEAQASKVGGKVMRQQPTTGEYCIEKMWTLWRQYCTHLDNYGLFYTVNNNNIFVLFSTVVLHHHHHGLLLLLFCDFSSCCCHAMPPHQQQGSCSCTGWRNKIKRGLHADS